MDMSTEMFPGQRKGEIVRLIVTKHWVIYIRMLRELLIFTFVPIMGMLFFTADTSSNIKYMTYFFSLIYMAYFFLIVFIRWLNEMLDVLIVTNQRLISIEQVNIFQNAASETNLPMIQDVKGRKKGIWGGLLHFGDMEIQTAAEKIQFKIQDVTNPYTKAKAILNIRDEFIKAYEVHGHDGAVPHNTSSAFPGYTSTASDGSMDTDM